MLSLSESEIRKTQYQIQREAERQLFAFLDQATDLIHAIFPQANVVDKSEGHAEHKLPITELVSRAIQYRKQWIQGVLQKSVEVSMIEEFDEPPPESVSLPLQVASELIRALLTILATGKDLNDNGLMFICNVTEALSIEPAVVDNLIEQVQYEKRREFTQLLTESLTSKQRYWVALMLWQAIHVDEKVHPREYKYFENIAYLVDQDQTKLRQLAEDSQQLDAVPNPGFDPQFVPHVFRYIVEIVMIDGEYDKKEAAFIQEVGRTFNYTKAQQDEIIQPVASALMLKTSLFAY